MIQEPGKAWSIETVTPSIPIFQPRRRGSVACSRKAIVSILFCFLFVNFLLFGLIHSSAWAAESTPFKDGLRAFRGKDYSQARNLFQQSLRADPGNAQAVQNLRRAGFDVPE